MSEPALRGQESRRFARRRGPTWDHLRAHVRLATSVGVVGAFLLGCREALLALQANAFVQAGQYFFLFVAVPIVTWVSMAAVLMVAVGVVAAMLRRHSEPRASFALYAALFAALGTLSITLPWRATIVSLLHDAGVATGFGIHSAFYLLTAAPAAGTAAVVGAAAAWYAQRREWPLRLARRTILMLGLLLLLPIGRFFVGDWKRPPAESEATAATQSRPNLLLISIDTLRADHLGSYGDTHGLTPRLDAFASQGVLFRQAITAAPWTLPAMASLFTGLYPRHHGAGLITNRRDPLGRSPLPAESWTLTAALQAAGYRTCAIVTNPYLSLRYGLGLGFDSYENVTIQSEAFVAFMDTTAARLLQWLWPQVIVGDRGETVSRKASAWLQTVPRNRPFFLWLHYVDPHPPYSRVTRHKNFRGDLLLATPVSEGTDAVLTSADVARLRSGEIRLSPEQKEGVRDLYRAEVASVDAAVGTVLDALERSGLAGNTVVVVVADHGEEFWEHGGVEHGHTVYEEVVHVPLLMRWSGHLPAAARVDSVVRTVDVVPTLLDLFALPTPPELDGETLLPLMTGRPSVPRVALTENLLFAEERLALRTADRKYVRWENGKEELYDLAVDPRERIDVGALGENLDPLRQLYAEIDRRVAAGNRRVSRARLDESTTEPLRALGYVH